MSPSARSVPSLLANVSGLRQHAHPYLDSGISTWATYYGTPRLDNSAKERFRLCWTYPSPP
ncbi:hypothetical protein PM082_010792 [Marasmius tenuissimus]|nr:hypothetical protein PM082_010792 [Marasmius tenuissimus]